MARNIELEYPRLSTYSYRQNWDGYTSGSSSLRTGQKYSRVIRPDVIRVPVVNGFRTPTPWYVKDVQWDDWSGLYKAADHYSSKPNDSRTVTCEGDMFYVDTGLYDIPKTATLPDVNELNRALSNALNNVKDSAVNLSVMFAESLKTIELVADRSLKLYQGFRLMKRGQYREAGKVFGVKVSDKGKSAANTHLELQYGWMPLVQDVANAYESTRQRYQREGFIIGAKSIILDKKKLYGRHPPVSGVTTWYSGTLKQASKVSLWYRVDSEALRQASRVGLTDVASVAWEVTPWSFVVDWFVPVGDWLTALTAGLGLSFLGGTSTRMVEQVCKGYAFTCSHKQGSHTWVGEFADIESASRYFEMDRKVYTSSPVPVPYYKSPFSTVHALNSVALLRTLK